jgi:hypothetical protein
MAAKLIQCEVANLAALSGPHPLALGRITPDKHGSPLPEEFSCFLSFS